MAITTAKENGKKSQIFFCIHDMMVSELFKRRKDHAKTPIVLTENLEVLN